MEDQLIALQHIIDYTFVNTNSLLTALNTSGHSSSTIIANKFAPLDTNARLAVYGDSIGHAYLCRQWIRSKLDKSTLIHSYTILRTRNLLTDAQILGTICAARSWAVTTSLAWDSNAN